MRVPASIAIAVAAFSSAAAAQELVGQKEMIFTVTEHIAAGGAVRIFSRTGDISITEGSGETVEFRAEKDVRRGHVEDIAFRVIRGAAGVTICVLGRRRVRRPRDPRRPCLALARQLARPRDRDHHREGAAWREAERVVRQR